MSEPLDELYLTWLYSQVGSVKLKRPSRTYWSLMRQLFRKEFVHIVHHDENRIEDGRDLRLEFLDSEEIEDADPAWLDLGCSMLELFVGLSRRLSFQAEGEPRDWFWHLLENLDIADHTDVSHNAEEVNVALDRVIWRTYDYDGRGGIFPLQRATRDQRKTEIWYQLSAYLLERL